MRTLPILHFFFCGGGIHQLNNEYLNFSSHPHRSQASTSGSVLGFGAGDPECVHFPFFFLFFFCGGEEFINSIMNTRIFPYTFTVVWLAQVVVCWALVQEIPNT